MEEKEQWPPLYAFTESLPFTKFLSLSVL
jgi:hypothetical protein